MDRRCQHKKIMGQYSRWFYCLYHFNDRKETFKPVIRKTWWKGEKSHTSAEVVCHRYYPPCVYLYSGGRVTKKIASPK